MTVTDEMIEAGARAHAATLNSQHEDQRDGVAAMRAALTAALKVAPVGGVKELEWKDARIAELEVALRGGLGRKLNVLKNSAKILRRLLTKWPAPPSPRWKTAWAGASETWRRSAGSTSTARLTCAPW